MQKIFELPHPKEPPAHPFDMAGDFGGVDDWNISGSAHNF